jgi:hypothetical protein
MRAVARYASGETGQTRSWALVAARSATLSFLRLRRTVEGALHSSRAHLGGTRNFLVGYTRRYPFGIDVRDVAWTALRFVSRGGLGCSGTSGATVARSLPIDGP